MSVRHERWTIYRTTNTGHLAAAVTLCATLPIVISRRPVRPRVPTTRRSASPAAASKAFAVESASVLNRVTYTTDNRIIEIRISKGRADKFSYKTEIR